MQTATPASVSSAALKGMASNASTLYAHQSANDETLAPCAAISAAILYPSRACWSERILIAVAVGQAQEHQDFVEPIAVRMDLDRPVEDADEGLQAEVAPGRGAGVALGLLGVEGVEFGPVGAGLVEGALDGRLDAHAGVGEAADPSGDVLPERELDPLRDALAGDDQLAPVGRA